MTPGGALRAGIGILGGTFDPIHLGHLRAAEEVGEALGLERIHFVPSADPPHKRGRGPDGDALAPAALRLAWVRAAVCDNPRFAADDLEIERGGTSWAVDTLTAFAGRGAPHPPVFLLGWDAFLDLGSWREPETVIRLAHLAVMTRPPARAGSLRDGLPAALRDDVAIAPDGLSGRHRRAGTEIRLVPVSALEISASKIRRRLREGRSVRYLLPDAVLEAVQKSGVYT